MDIVSKGGAGWLRSQVQRLAHPSKASVRALVKIDGRVFAHHEYINFKGPGSRAEVHDDLLGESLVGQSVDQTKSVGQAPRDHYRHPRDHQLSTTTCRPKNFSAPVKLMNPAQRLMTRASSRDLAFAGPGIFG